MTRLSAFFLVVVATACGHTAHITRADGAYVDGRIVWSDRSHVTVMRDDESLVRVPREEIDDIDHPGTAAIISSLGMMGACGVLVGFGVLTMCSGNGDACGPGPGSLALMSIGAGMGIASPFVLIYGAVVGAKSRSAARPSLYSASTARPTLWLDPAHGNYGAGWSITF